MQGDSNSSGASLTLGEPYIGWANDSIVLNEGGISDIIMYIPQYANNFLFPLTDLQSLSDLIKHFFVHIMIHNNFLLLQDMQ